MKKTIALITFLISSASYMTSYATQLNNSNMNSSSKYGYALRVTNMTGADISGMAISTSNQPMFSFNKKNVAEMGVNYMQLWDGINLSVVNSWGITLAKIHVQMFQGYTVQKQWEFLLCPNGEDSDGVLYFNLKQVSQGC